MTEPSLRSAFARGFPLNYLLLFNNSTPLTGSLNIIPICNAMNCYLDDLVTAREAGWDKFCTVPDLSCALCGLSVFSVGLLGARFIFRHLSFSALAAT